MVIVSANKFLLWKKKQLFKGGDSDTLSLLIESLTGISKSEVNLYKIDLEKKINLKISLNFIEKLWDEYLQTSIPIQYLFK